MRLFDDNWRYTEYVTQMSATTPKRYRNTKWEQAKRLGEKRREKIMRGKARNWPFQNKPLLNKIAPENASASTLNQRPLRLLIFEICYMWLVLAWDSHRLLYNLYFASYIFHTSLPYTHYRLCTWLGLPFYSRELRRWNRINIFYIHKSPNICCRF